MGDFGTPQAWTPDCSVLSGGSPGHSPGAAAPGRGSRSPIESSRLGDDEVCGLLADGYHFLQILGGKPGPVAASGRDRPSVSSSLGVHVTVRGGFAARAVSVADHVLGNSVGAIGWLLAPSVSKLSGLGGAGLVPGCLRAPLPSSYSARCPHRVPPRGAPSGVRSALKIVTWLILPVVICLSQRLSHACLSISTYTVKLRMAH